MQPWEQKMQLLLQLCWDPHFAPPADIVRASSIVGWETRTAGAEGTKREEPQGLWGVRSQTVPSTSRGAGAQAFTKISMQRGCPALSQGRTSCVVLQLTQQKWH